MNTQPEKTVYSGLSPSMFYLIISTRFVIVPYNQVNYGLEEVMNSPSSKFLIIVLHTFRKCDL